MIFLPAIQLYPTNEPHLIVSPALLVVRADPESFVRGGPTLTKFLFFHFSVDESREDPNTTKNGSLSHYQPVSKKRFASGPMMVQH